MTPIYICVRYKNSENFRFAYFEDIVTAINVAAGWLTELRSMKPEEEVVFFSKNCVPADRPLKAVIAAWIAKKQLPQQLVVPFVTRGGVVLDRINPLGAGWVLTNENGDEVRTTSDLPVEFLLESLMCDDIPELCPVAEFQDMIAALPDDNF